MITTGRYAFLPAGEIFEQGACDLAAGAVSLPALLLAMAWPRLEPLGLVTRAQADRVRTPREHLEISAYRALARVLGDEAHARFIALSAELESGINALEREHRLRAEPDPSG